MITHALDRSRREQDRRADETRIRLAGAAARAGFWQVDVTTGRVWASPEAFRLHGMPTDGPRTLDEMLSTIHPDDREDVRGKFQTTIARLGDYAAEFRVVHADGQVRWLAARGAIHDPGSGESPSVLGVTVDSTERRRAEDDLRSALTEVRRLKDELHGENVYLRQEVERSVRSSTITGASAALEQVLVQAERVAGTASTVLLLGETGTGKERFAAYIHNLSPRRHRVMVRVNCAAIPATLIESELFGREKGAYTGALSRQVGRFETANGSTIFLDEIGDLPPDVQVKLLRVLQERQIERLGSPAPIPVDIRVIAATHQNLEEAVKTGKFRSDLYYRLNVFPITIPPLRERREDIPLLVGELVAELGAVMGRQFERVSKSSLDALARYDWPGNVRELRNILERAMIMGSGPTLHVPAPWPVDSPTPGPVGEAIADLERHHILHVLNKTGWRIRGDGGAAKALGLKPTTLEHRMASLGITRPNKREP
jgi:formate hydrogenlyase transcriptional activator